MKSQKNPSLRERTIDIFAYYLPDSVVSKLRPVWRSYLNLKNITYNKLYEFGDRLGIIGPDQVYNSDYYKKRRKDPRRADARSIALDKEFQPQSIIHFGCAIGHHLEYFHQKGKYIKGVEGSSKAIEYAVIPAESIEQFDLREYYETRRNFDLVLSFEVAEHIPEKYSDNFIRTLASAGDTVLMTAAPPGQGGTHHVNEKPPEYWHKKFALVGMEYNDEITQRLKEKITVEKTIEIPKNIMVYTNKNETKNS